MKTMRTLPNILWVVLLAFSFVGITASEPAYAQLNFFGTASDLSLRTAPEYPRPGENVRLSVLGSLTDLSSSNIKWYANGKIVAQGIGLTEASVAAGSLGSETQIRVEVAGSDATTGVLRPTEVDLLWESDSYIPPFYRGRALPSAGSAVRLFAIPRLQYSGAQSPVSPEELIYTWKKNNKVIAPASGRGKHTALLEGPALFGTDTVSVEVRTTDGGLRGFSSVRIASVEPLLVLYENHPLFGVLYHRALKKVDSIPEVEATLSATPYFAPSENPGDLFFRYAWRVNNSDVENDPSNPNTITLNAEGSTGRAFIELALTHATNFFLSSFGTWNLTLNEANDASFSDPFNSSTR